MALDIEDAIQYIIGYVRSGRKSDYGTFGYGIYLDNMVRDYLLDAGVIHRDLDAQLHGRRVELSRAFYAAAWELCRRGILRPGVRAFREQSTENGSSGSGYSLTPYGEEWLAADPAPAVPLEAGRLARALADAGLRYGSGFVERSQEAVRSYHALAYLACCAMCGAAAESIILALAIAKSGDDAQRLRRRRWPREDREAGHRGSAEGRPGRV